MLLSAQNSICLCSLQGSIECYMLIIVVMGWWIVDRYTVVAPHTVGDGDPDHGWFV